MLELESIVAGYGGGDVLQGLDLAVERGSLTCIVGPNGAGKSTVLRVVSGLLRPRAGTVVLEGEAIGGAPPADILRRGIVQVPQQHALFPKMTISENVLMGAYAIRRDRKLVRKRFAEVEAIFPIVRERGRDRAGNLSGGQRRMVEFARSFMLDPKLVLLDEPSLGLDPRSLKHVYETIERVREAGKTVLLVEQNVRVGLQHATHAVVMERGQVRLAGSAREILENRQIADLYLGGAPELHDGAKTAS